MHVTDEPPSFMTSTNDNKHLSCYLMLPFSKPINASTLHKVHGVGICHFPNREFSQHLGVRFIFSMLYYLQEYFAIIYVIYLYIIRIPTGIRGFGHRSSHICLSIHEIGTSPSSVIAVTLMVATAANDRARGLQKYSLQEVAVDFVKFIRIIVYQPFRTNSILYIIYSIPMQTYIHVYDLLGPFGTLEEVANVFPLGIPCCESKAISTFTTNQSRSMCQAIGSLGPCCRLLLEELAMALCCRIALALSARGKAGLI